MHAAETPRAAAPIHLPTIAPEHHVDDHTEANTHPRHPPPPPTRQGCRPCRSDSRLCTHKRTVLIGGHHG